MMFKMSLLLDGIQQASDIEGMKDSMSMEIKNAALASAGEETDGLVR